MRTGPRTALTRAPLFIAGHHEPLVFRRRGGWVHDGAEEFGQEHSPQNALALKELGINWVRVHFFKGFGIAAESAEMETAREWIARLHEVGIRTETYLQFSNIMYETFFLERPEAACWIQLTQEGHPNRLCYGHQAWRYLMCYNSPEWEQYLRDVVRKAVVEARTDQIAWDNYDINITPDFCYCQRCREAFRRFLDATYPDAPERIRRYGFADFSQVLPPVYNRWNPVLGLRSIRDPLIQDWASFVAGSKAAGLERLNDYGRSLRSDLTVNCNGVKSPTENLTFTRGLDVARMCRTTDLIGSEEHHYPHVRDDGVLVTNIRTKKRCAAFGTAAQNYVYAANSSRRVATLALAESAAFDLVPVTIVGILERRSSDERWTVWDFMHSHESLLSRRTVPAARIALLRGNASLRHNRLETYVAALQIEQLLIEKHFIFQIIEDAHLEDLSSYSLLILPGTECLGAREAELMRAYVRTGGGLLCVGDVGLFDEWRRPLDVPRFADLTADGAAGGGAWSASLGKGVVRAVPLVPGGYPGLRSRRRRARID